MLRLLPEHIRNKICINPITHCWDWYGEKTTNGYGRAWLRGTRTMAHRIVYELFIGVKVYSREFDHTCLNRGCVNPDHMEIVTRQVNLKRRRYK